MVTTDKQFLNSFLKFTEKNTCVIFSFLIKLQDTCNGCLINHIVFRRKLTSLNYFKKFEQLKSGVIITSIFFLFLMKDF